MRVIRTIGVVVAVLAGVSSAQAQTGPCPGGTGVAVVPIGGTINLCVEPSLSTVNGHNALDVNSGLPVVTRYDVILLNEADTISGPAQATINIGKPALNSDNVFWVVLPNASVPINRRFRVTGVAIGQPGSTASSRSALSNSFIVANPTNPGVPIRTAVP